MNTIRYVLQPLRDLFERLKAVTMPEMKSALGTEVDQTVFRKLAQLPYRTSYSHRGGFYTLESFARFNEQGLWGCRGAWFSRHGTLLATAQNLVSEAPAGYFAHELEAGGRRLHELPLRTSSCSPGGRVGQEDREVARARDARQRRQDTRQEPARRLQVTAARGSDRL